MELIELNRKSTKVHDKQKTDDMIKNLKKEHNKLVKGKFEFIDAQGGSLPFSYRFFKDDPIYVMRLTHGEICEIPLGIVKHLNNTTKKVRTMSPSLDARTGKSSYEIVSRVRFTPMEYL